MTDSRVDGAEADPAIDAVADLLVQYRQEIVDRWVVAASAQPFHAGRDPSDVTNHMPSVLDALTALMRRSSADALTSGSAIHDEEVLTQATAHANRRFEQGLHPADVVTEFRLLRQAIGRAVWEHLPDDTPPRAAGLAELFVHDALDGTTTLGLTAFVRQIEEVREVILATTMHEVRQPITSIRGGIQLAKRQLAARTSDASAAVESLNRAEAATDQMMLILDRLSYASRLALSRLELDRTPTDLLAVVRDALGRLQAADAAHVRVDVAAGTDTTGQWDATALGQVVSNLLSNAIKYSPDAAPIEIRLFTEATGEDDAIHLSVSDRGIGLEPHESAELFRRYARASGAVEQGIPGVGLGLFLVRGIVEAHGGRVSVESAGHGHGSTFHVVIPRRPETTTTD